MKPEPEIVILEDQQVTADFLVEIIARSGLGSAIVFNDYESASLYMNREGVSPAIAFCDISIGGELLGLEFAEQLSKKFNCQIIILSAYSTEEFVQKAHEFNAVYLVKPVQRRQVEVALQMALKRMVDQRLIIPENLKLTKREMEIVQLIAKGYNSRKIAVELFISYETVLTHRRNMLQKNGLNNCYELIRQIPGLNPA